MEIKLISKTPNYLKTCWTAARTCYSADSPIELLAQEKTEEEMLRLLDRIGVSLSVQSQRYVSEQSAKQTDGLFGHVVPQTVADNEATYGRYMACMREIQKAYDDLLALGVTKQDARFVLPGGACTNFVTTLNLRSFMDVYEKRVTTPGAQWEIKEMMLRMRDLIVAEEPWLERFIPRG